MLWNLLVIVLLVVVAGLIVHFVATRWFVSSDCAECKRRESSTSTIWGADDTEPITSSSVQHGMEQHFHEQAHPPQPQHQPHYSNQPPTTTTAPPPNFLFGDDEDDL